MLQTWDFIDPKLARKLHELHEYMQELKKKRIQIIKNPRISEPSRKNLLSYNDKCLNDLLQLYQIQKNKMTDYFDNQVQVLTKKQVRIAEKVDKQQYLQKEPSLENMKIDTSIKNNESFNGCENLNIRLRENQEIQESFQNNHKSLYRRKIKIGQSFQDSENSTENGYKLQYLDTTGRFTNKTMKYERDRAVRSFQLATTNRNQSYSYQYPHEQSTDFKATTKYNESSSNKKFRKAKISHKRYNRIKTRLSFTELQLQLQKLSHRETALKLRKLMRESNEEKQLIQLLYTKISLIQNEKKNIIEEERTKIEKKFQDQLEDLRQKYIDLSSLQEKNRELMVKRKQMLKFGNSL